MDEQIRIQLSADGQPLPIERLRPDGIVVLHGESSGEPRRLLLEFDGVGEATRTRMRFVQQRHGWHPWIFNLHAADGSLRAARAPLEDGGGAVPLLRHRRTARRCRGHRVTGRPLHV